MNRLHLQYLRARVEKAEAEAYQSTNVQEPK